jgi:hypothetical protein
VKSIEKVLKKKDLKYLTKEAYNFITLRCGSIAHFSIEGWRYHYRDLRDFLDFFLVKNEYAECLVKVSELDYWSVEDREMIREIIATCSKYRNNVFFELDEKERKQSVEVAKRLMNGEITLKQLFNSYADIQHGER